VSRAIQLAEHWEECSNCIHSLICDSAVVTGQCRESLRQQEGCVQATYRVSTSRSSKTHRMRSVQEVEAGELQVDAYSCCNNEVGSKSQGVATTGGAVLCCKQRPVPTRQADVTTHTNRQSPPLHTGRHHRLLQQSALYLSLNEPLY
jgi:hypothetical protein